VNKARAREVRMLKICWIGFVGASPRCARAGEWEQHPAVVDPPPLLGHGDHGAGAGAAGRLGGRAGVRAQAALVVLLPGARLRGAPSTLHCPWRSCRRACLLGPCSHAGIALAALHSTVGYDRWPGVCELPRWPGPPSRPCLRAECTPGARHSLTWAPGPGVWQGYV